MSNGYSWDKNGNIVYDNPQPQLPWYEQVKRNLMAFGGNLDTWLNSGNDTIEKERANFGLGLATAPIGAGATLTANIAKPLVPLVGKKIGQSIASGIGSGLTGGAVEGFGRGLIEQENPLKTMAQDALLYGAFGGLGGYGLGRIAKGLEKQRILGNADNAEMLDNWFSDYVDGITNKTKPLAEYRGLKQGIANGFSGNEHLFIGENAFNAPKGKLMEAQQMQMYGSTPKEVFENTGWFKGVDDKWRYEIPDGDIIQNPHLNKAFDSFFPELEEYSGILPDVLDNPELYKNYPFLKEVPIYFEEMDKPSIRGYSTGESLGIDKNLLPIVNPQYNARLAELENTPEFLKYKASLEDYNPLIEEEFLNTPIGKEWNKLIWDESKEMPQFLQKGDEDKLKETLLHEVQHLIQDKENFARGASSQTPNYYKFAGEVEARKVGRRRNIPEHRRKQILPFEFYDVKPEEQIVEFKKNGLYNKIVKKNNEEFDFEKVKKLSEDLKNGKRNPLRNETNSVRIDNISPRQKEYIFNEIVSSISDDEKAKGIVTRRLHNYDEKKDYLYTVIYDKNGQHQISRSIKIDDDIYD